MMSQKVGHRGWGLLGELKPNSRKKVFFFGTQIICLMNLIDKLDLNVSPVLA